MLMFVEDRLLQLTHLEEKGFVAGIHQNIEKKRKKLCLDKHIQSKHFEVGGLVLMYGSKFFNHPRNLKTH